MDAHLSDGTLFGVHWHFWKVIGWLGNAAFFSRFFIQWYVSEKQKQVVVPVAFWWLSLVGSICLLCYALFFQHDSVFIFAYAFTWIPYIRNLLIHKRSRRGVQCRECSRISLISAKYCSACGAPIPLSETAQEKA